MWKQPYVIWMAWLYSNKTLFTKTCGWCSWSMGCSLLNPDIGYLYVVFFYHKYIQFWTILNKISLYKRISKSNYPEIKYMGKVILKYMYYFVYRFFKLNFKSLLSISAYFFSIHAHTPVWYWLPPQQSSCTTIPWWYSVHFIPLPPFFFNLYFLKFSPRSYLPKWWSYFNV